MRLWISGPSAGPVHTSLVSVRGGRGGRHSQWWYLIPLALLAPVIGLLLLHNPVAVVLFGLVAVAVIGGFWQEHQRKTPAGPHYGAAGPNDAAIVADLNTRPADVRGRLREMCATGELAMIPGYHWTTGDVQVRDEPAMSESPAKYSDRS